MAEQIGGVYTGLDASVETFPADDVALDPTAYVSAMATMPPGAAVIVFTPDDTHYDIALAALARGLHVLVAKPLVKTLAQHAALVAASAEHGGLCAVEYHKRWDPMYSDAVERIRRLGPFSYFYSAMTQRVTQLDTFAGWAGIRSDISYYLNSHHIDVHAWALRGASRPARVVASASTGVATSRLSREGAACACVRVWMLASRCVYASCSVLVLCCAVL